MEVRTPEGRKPSFCDVRIREMDGLESKITWKFALAMFVPHGNYQSTSGWVVQMIFVNEHAESGWHCKTSDLVVSLKHLGAFKDPVVLWQIGLWVSRQHKIGSPLPWKNKIENFHSNRANQYSQYDITITVVYLFSSARMHASTDLFCSLFANYHFFKIVETK